MTNWARYSILRFLSRSARGHRPFFEPVTTNEPLSHLTRLAEAYPSSFRRISW